MVLLFVPSRGEDRGTKPDRFEKVRGDSGKWRDQSRLQVVPSPSAKISLDEWADSRADKESRLATSTETWLVYQTEQLDDNDRLWVEAVTRKGNEIEVVFHRATWQGYYSKNFTWYGVWGLNLGQLPAGDYQVKWIVKPYTFKQFVDPKNRRQSWPVDEVPSKDGKESVHALSFSIR